MEKGPGAVKSGDTVMTILLVADKPAYMPLLTHLLRTVYQVWAANSGENALLLATGEPHLDLVSLTS